MSLSRTGALLHARQQNPATSVTHVVKDGWVSDLAIEASTEIHEGRRFAFGENWSRFLELVDADRISAAEDSLRNKVGQLEGRTFVDVGCGSGLFSLAACNLGAAVRSFDFDAQSVACTEELRRRYRPDDNEWRIEQGSALDSSYLHSLGQFDIVYSWGVLHHTGDMWTALGNVANLVAPKGRLFISIYNDQGRWSKNWTRLKRSYVSAGPTRRRILQSALRLYFAKGPAYRAITRRPSPPRPRGMDRNTDILDWIGGYPFEVAKPERVFDYFRERQFILDQLTTCGGRLGCNQFVFSLPPRVTGSTEDGQVRC